MIVCEKPLAASLRDAARLVDACERHGARLIVNHERRYDPRYAKIRSMIEDGVIGQVRTVHASILTGGFRGVSRAEMGGGPLLHDGTHMIDLIRYLFGDIVSVAGEFDRAGGRKSGFEDRAAAWLKTRGGIDVFLEAGGSREYFVFELSISGTKERLSRETDTSRCTPRVRRGIYRFRDPWSACFRVIDAPTSSRTSIEAGRLLSGEDGPVSSTGTDGYRAIEAIHATHSAAKGRKLLNYPLTGYNPH